jgi:hypothetical protein
MTSSTLLLFFLSFPADSLLFKFVFVINLFGIIFSKNYFSYLISCTSFSTSYFYYFSSSNDYLAFFIFSLAFSTVCWSCLEASFFIYSASSFNYYIFNFASAINSFYFDFNSFYFLIWFLIFLIYFYNFTTFCLFFYFLAFSNYLFAAVSLLLNWSRILL